MSLTGFSLGVIRSAILILSPIDTYGPWDSALADTPVPLGPRGTTVERPGGTRGALLGLLGLGFIRFMSGTMRRLGMFEIF